MATNKNYKSSQGSTGCHHRMLCCREPGQHASHNYSFCLQRKRQSFGEANVCNTRGLAYVSLSMAIGSIYIWSYVYNVMLICSTKNPDDAKMDALPEGVEPAGDLPKCSTGPLLSAKHPSVDEGHMVHLELEGGVVSEEKAKVPFPGNIKRGCLKVIRNPNLGRLFSPSIIGAIIGFAIGSIPLLKKALIGDSAPLRVVEDSVYLLGESAVIIMTLIVGANLLKNKHFKGSRVPISVIIGVVAVRYTAWPILGVLIINFAVHFGLLHSDPLYQFILLLQFALPPAISIGVMTQLFGEGQTECSEIMLWTYALATVSLTLWSAFFLWFVR